MLTKDCRRMLNTLNKSCDDSGYLSNLNNIYTELSPQINKMKLVSILEYLKNNGYLDFYIDLSYEISDIKLTHKGTHYREISLLEFKNFLYKSIFTPIVVAIITTLLKDYLLNK